MARPNFPMMGINMPGMHPNMSNLSHPSSMQMNMMASQMGAYPGMMPHPMGMQGNINHYFFNLISSM